MNIDQIKQHLAAGVAIGCGVLLAVFLGKEIGSGKFGLVGYLMGGVIWAIIAFSMQQRCAVLIPACWMLTGQLTQLPLPITMRELVVFTVFFTFFILLAFKILKRRPTVDRATFLLTLCFVWLAFAFARNPTGLDFLGSTRVGARPYLTVFVAAVAFWVLLRSSASAGTIRWLPWVMAGLVASSGLIALACEKIQPLAALIGPFYSDFNSIDRAAQMPTSFDPEGDVGVRYGMLEMPGRFLAVLLCCAFRPLSLLNPVNFGRFLLFILALVAIAFSGFRSGIIYTGMAFVLGSYFHRGRMELFRISMIAIPIMAVIILAHGRLFELPYTFQRALSFLPAEWDYQTKQSAIASTEWRHEIWKEVITTDRYIENKLLGDGFGLTKEQFETIRAINAHGLLSNEQTQENAKITGAFHSGPLNTVRVFGYIGLLLFYLLLFASAALALRLLKRAMKTPFQTLAVLLAVRCVADIFNFTLVFGAFEIDFPEAIFKLGMLKFLANSLDEWDRERGSVDISNSSRVPVLGATQPALGVS